MESVREVLIWNITNGPLDSISFPIHITDIAKDILFVTMELPVQPALRIRHRSNVKHDRLPFEARAPNEPLKPHVQISAGINQQLHYGPAVILVAVHRVK